MKVLSNEYVLRKEHTKEMKIANSDLLSLFISSNVTCYTATAKTCPTTPSYNDISCADLRWSNGKMANRDVYVQQNFNGSNTDGLFTTAVSSSFLSPLEQIP